MDPGSHQTSEAAVAERLPEAVTVACWELITGRLLDNPRRLGAPLDPPYDGEYRARCRDYRIRYELDEQRMTLSVISIDHRRDAYRS